jgi:hypothetical protein
MDTTRTCFHDGGKYCLRRTALNTFVGKVIVRFCKCIRILFGLPFGPGALPTLSPLMACRTSEGPHSLAVYIYARDGAGTHFQDDRH